MGNKYGYITAIILVVFIILNLPAQQGERKVIEIELKGYLTDKEVEVSGMEWFGENLIFLPQYPEIKE